MATTRTANAHWEGSLTEGAGTVSLDSSGLGRYDVSWPARTEQPDGKTSPEELIAAAHSTCYSMSLALALDRAGTPPQSIDTRADVGFQPGVGITGVQLTVRGRVEQITNEQFMAAAESAKSNCPVSKALAGTTITLDAALAD